MLMALPGISAAAEHGGTGGMQHGGSGGHDMAKSGTTRHMTIPRLPRD
jgi:hypothetical protein